MAAEPAIHANRRLAIPRAGQPDAFSVLFLDERADLGVQFHSRALSFCLIRFLGRFSCKRERLRVRVKSRIRVKSRTKF